MTFKMSIHFILTIILLSVTQLISSAKSPQLCSIAVSGLATFSSKSTGQYEEASHDNSETFNSSDTSTNCTRHTQPTCFNKKHFTHLIKEAQTPAYEYIPSKKHADK